MSDFRKILVWQKAMALTTKIYNNSQKFPKEEIFGLTSQLRRSAISIPSNIAEGIGRDSKNELLRFLTIAMGSLFELQTQLEIAKNINFLKEEEFNNMYEDSREIERMLVAFIKKNKRKQLKS